MRFRRPHALSATARLEFVSHHRTQPAADAILLMGETCVLGPGASSHVVCRDWPHDVIIYRHDGQLHVRGEGTLEIDGAPHEGRGPVAMGSQVIGADFSLSLEKA
jgi:hypothetical protein